MKRTTEIVVFQLKKTAQFMHVSVWNCIEKKRQMEREKNEIMSWRHNCNTQTGEIVETTMQMIWWWMCVQFGFHSTHFYVIQIKRENVMLLHFFFACLLHLLCTTEVWKFQALKLFSMNHWHNIQLSPYLLCLSWSALRNVVISCDGCMSWSQRDMD